MRSSSPIFQFIVPNVNIYTYIITTEDTENTEGVCLHFLYSVFSLLSVVKFSLEISEGIWSIDCNQKKEQNKPKTKGEILK